MNKEVIVHLLQKDIKELSLLTDGFEKMSEFPEPILRLAKEKTENILKSLENLSDWAFLELGAVDCDDLAEKEAEPILESESHLVEEQNNVDVPLGAVIEPQVSPYDKEVESDEMDEIQEADTRESESEVNVEKESPLDKTVENVENSQTETEEANFELETAESDTYDSAVAIDLEDESTDQAVGVVPVVEVEEKEDKTEIYAPTPIFNDTLNYEDKSIAGNLAHQKIDDIKQAINIGDRFRFQRELFGGNGEVLNKTISYLNQLANYSEAESFLKSKFGWEEDNPHAEEFLQIVKRRYL